MRISDWSSDVCSSDLLADDAADARDARIILARPHRLAGGLGIGAHRTDLENVIGLAEQADAGLAIEDRPAAIEHHRDPRDDDRRQADDQNDQTGEDIEQALADLRSEVHPSELQSLMRNSY